MSLFDSRRDSVGTAASQRLGQKANLIPKKNDQILGKSYRLKNSHRNLLINKPNKDDSLIADTDDLSTSSLSGIFNKNIGA